MKKYDFYKQVFGDQSAAYRERLRTVLMNKYYNLWMNKYKWDGLDEDNCEQQQHFIMKTLWAQGKVALRTIKSIGVIIPTQFVEKKYNILDFPETVNLIKKRDASERIIPMTEQKVNKDVAVIYVQPNHKSIKLFVTHYVEKMIFIEMILRTNLVLQKMPFLIGVEDESEKQLKDIIDRLVNDDPVIFGDFGDVNNIKSVITGTPYIADKLKSMIVSTENELLTFLGIDNNGSAEKAAQMTVDEVNANNDSINEYGASITDYLQQWIDRANKVLDRNLSINAKSMAVDTNKEMDLQSPPDQSEQQPTKEEQQQ